MPRLREAGTPRKKTRWPKVQEAPQAVKAVPAKLTVLPPDETLLSAEEAAQALQTLGFPVTAPGLKSMRFRHNGPPFKRFGRRCLYPWAATKAWAYARTEELAA